MAEPVVQPSDEVGHYSMFFPIKVVNGFVTCDFKLGCYCCKFCLNRRYPDWNRLLEMNKVYRNPLQVEHAVHLLQQVRPFQETKVTLKFGHDTDMSLEEREVQQLFPLLPADQPVVFMRRGKLLPEFRPFYLEPKPNLLMELTLTPRSQSLEYHLNPFEILRSFEGVKVNMFFTVGPVCEDNYDEAKEILRAIPPGSKVWVRDLIKKDIPRLGTEKASDYRTEELREFAHSQGHSVISYLNCVVRAEVGLPFHKRGEFVSEPNTWQLRWCEACKVKNICCHEAQEGDEQQQIRFALETLGLTLAKPLRRFAHKSYTVVTHEEVNFGDECYLREKTGLKIDLWKEGSKTGTALTRSIAARWKKHNFYPVDEMLELAKASYALAFPAER